MNLRKWAAACTAAIVLVACGGGGDEAPANIPPPTSPPASGGTPSYVRLQSDPGDYIGSGASYEYTRANATLAVTANAGRLTVGVTGDEWWNADFAMPGAFTRLEPGTYNGLTRYPFHNAAAGGLTWSGEGRGCNTLTGSFTITSVTYTGSTLTAIDLRFEQHCEGGGPALRGQIHWSAADATQAAGPQTPPADLWQPPANATPAMGNYVYLQSDTGDFIGGGQTTLYTPSTATLTLNSAPQLLRVGVGIGTGSWSGEFASMTSVTQLRAGYYGNLERYPFHNPARGGLSWSGMHRGCNTLSGWYVIDSITYAGSAVASVELRFEQHCERGGPALRGKVRLSN